MALRHHVGRPGSRRACGRRPVLTCCHCAGPRAGSFRGARGELSVSWPCPPPPPPAQARGGAGGGCHVTGRRSGGGGASASAPGGGPLPTGHARGRPGGRFTEGVARNEGVLPTGKGWMGRAALRAKEWVTAPRGLAGVWVSSLRGAHTCQQRRRLPPACS